MLKLFDITRNLPLKKKKTFPNPKALNIPKNLCYFVENHYHFHIITLNSFFPHLCRKCNAANCKIAKDSMVSWISNVKKEYRKLNSV